MKYFKLIQAPLLIFLFVIGILFSDTGFCLLEINTKGGLKVSDPKKPDYSLNIGGTIHLDQTQFMGSAEDKLNQFPSGATIRHLFLDFQGNVGENWAYLMELSLLPENRIDVSVRTIQRSIFLNYKGFENTNILLGQVPIPSSIENFYNDNDLFFLENSLGMACFFPENDYGIGVYIDRTIQDTWSIMGAVYQPSQDDLFAGVRGLGRSDPLGEALRLVYSPIHTKTCVYHFGAWVRHQAYIDTLLGEPVPLELAFDGFADDPEAQARNTGSLVDTGHFRAKTVTMSGVEFATLWGPLMLQAEYLHAYSTRRFSNTNPAFPAKALNFYGAYVQGSYILTGESRPYDLATGTFLRPVPEHCYGAWEIVARYSTADLTDRDIYGGIENNVTLGLNWYINEQVRISNNYIYAAAKTYPSPDINIVKKRKLNIFATRLQIAF